MLASSCLVFSQISTMLHAIMQGRHYNYLEWWVRLAFSRERLCAKKKTLLKCASGMKNISKILPKYREIVFRKFCRKLADGERNDCVSAPTTLLPQSRKIIYNKYNTFGQLPEITLLRVILSEFSRILCFKHQKTVLLIKEF